MKRFFLFAALLLLSCPALRAQSYGIKGGVNFASLTGNDTDGFKSLTGFHIGGLAEFRIVGRLYLQPELLYSVQGAEIDGEKYRLNYITVPVMVKFDVTDALTLHAGPQFGLLAGETAGVVAEEGNSYDFAIAGGLDFYITDGIFLEARYVRGQNQIFDNADAKNSVIQLSLGFFF